MQAERAPSGRQALQAPLPALYSLQPSRVPSLGLSLPGARSLPSLSPWYLQPWHHGGLGMGGAGQDSGCQASSLMGAGGSRLPLGTTVCLAPPRGWRARPGWPQEQPEAPALSQAGQGARGILAAGPGAALRPCVRPDPRGPWLVKWGGVLSRCGEKRAPSLCGCPPCQPLVATSSPGGGRRSGRLGKPRGFCGAPHSARQQLGFQAQKLQPAQGHDASDPGPHSRSLEIQSLKYNLTLKFGAGI